MESRPRIHVLAVDDDPLSLVVLQRMLLRCQYQVTTCTRVAAAVQLLRKYPDTFDLVMSDVYMPDADGFKLLEAVGLEMGLPVIMMSANGETSVVMRGITHGACDYLIKPIRMEELKTIWQHVVRRRGKQDMPMMRSEEAQLVEGVSAAGRKLEHHQRMSVDGAQQELAGLGLINTSGSNLFSHSHSTRGNAGIWHRAAARSGSFVSLSGSGLMGGTGGGGSGLLKTGSLDIGLLLKMQQEDE